MKTPKARDFYQQTDRNYRLTGNNDLQEFAKAVAAIVVQDIESFAEEFDSHYGLRFDIKASATGPRSLVKEPSALLVSDTQDSDGEAETNE